MAKRWCDGCGDPIDPDNLGYHRRCHLIGGAPDDGGRDIEYEPWPPGSL